MKHLSLAHADKAIAHILEVFGAEAYGVFWLICEDIAAQNHSYNSHTMAEWAKLCHCTKPVFREVLSAVVAEKIATTVFDGVPGSTTEQIGIAIMDLDIREDDGRLPASVMAEIRAIVFLRDDWICRYCNKRGGRLECDHIVPVSCGGSNDLSNFATACFSCNRSKRDKTLAEWRPDLVGL